MPSRPYHQRTVGSDGKGRVPVYRVHNPNKKLVVLDNGEFRLDLKPNQEVWLDEQGWIALKNLYGLEELIKSGLKYEQYLIDPQSGLTLEEEQKKLNDELKQKLGIK